MMIDRSQQLRIIEAILFSSADPIPEKVLKTKLPERTDVQGLIDELKAFYSNRGVHIVEVGKKSGLLELLPISQII